MINERTIRIWWDVFKKDCPLTEVRILGQGKTYSGYFTDPEVMLSQLRNYDGLGIYATINEVKESCYGRSQHDVIIQKPKSTTNDSDIENRKWILLDFDPERPSDTNASDAEKRHAEVKMRQVYKFLRDEGFNAPVVADSANGYHLYYAISAPNNQEATETVKAFLNALDMLFSDEKVKIDVSVFNASRIAKIIGTSSAKGTNTAERPQRESRFIHIPDTVEPTDMGFVQKVADMLPKVEQPSRYNGYSNERFDIEGFIRDHGIQIAKRTRFGGGEKLVLAECPFDSNHKAPDAAIFVMDSGAIGFRCLHNSCQHYTWRDVRLHYDPQAYDRRDYEEFSRKRSYYGRVNPMPVEPVKEDERGKKWLNMADIRWIDPSSYVSIPSGIEALDKKIAGFTLGDVTVMSGLSGAGKTTLLDHFILSAVQRGYKAAAYSGELQGFRFQQWIDQMAAGKAFVKQKPGFDGLYYAPKMVADKVNSWLDGKFFLYNNDYGNKWSLLYEDIRECVDKNGVQIVFVDNLMTIDLDNLDGEKNDRQSRFINNLKEFAKRSNIHIVLVCHPRKEQSFQLLRKESIAGTADLTNLADNLIISHRVGKDFERRAKDFFGDQRVAELMDYDLVLEVAKNRSFGVVDYLIGLFYEPESRRVKNSRIESIVYGWNDEPTQVEIPAEDIPDDVWYLKS